MKTIKKALSLFVAVMMMMTAMGSIGVFAAWPEDAAILDNTVGTSTATVKFDSADLQPVSGDYLLLEYTYTPKDTTTATYAGVANSDGSCWRPINFNANGKIMANHYQYPVTSGTEVGDVKVGETYSVVAVLKYAGSTNTYGRIFLNGEEIISSGYVGFSKVINRFYIGVGVNAKLSKLSGMTDLSDFNYDDYRAQVTTEENEISISADTYNSKQIQNFAIDITKKSATTVESLLSYLTKPTGATAKVYASDGTELQNTDVVESGNILKVTSKNGFTTLNYEITVGEYWPKDPVIVDNTSGTSSKGGDITVSDDDFLKIEYTYTPKAKAGTWAGLYQSSKDKVWAPIRFTADGKIQADYYYGAGANLKDIGEYVIGDTYSVVSVVQIKDGNKAKACIYLNGQQLFAEKTIYTTMATFGFNRLYAGAGTKATITKLTDITSVTEFDASAYAAQLTSTDSGIIITADKYNSTAFQNFGITTAKNVKASELLAALTIPQNATAKIYNAEGTEAGNDDTVLDGYSVKVTSANGFTTLTYDVTKVAAEEISYTTDADGNLIASVIENTQGNGKLYLAAYDTVNGKLVLSKVIAGKAADAQLPTLEAVFSASQFAGKTVKAFYWNANLIPIDFKEYTE